MPPTGGGTLLRAFWSRSSNIESIHLDDLLGIDKQKKVVEENTRQFLAGYPANNILLWGTRGTGKSSLVRALLHTYAPQGLRVVQVDKTDLVHLPDIVDEIKDQPFKFIIFSDDLSFDIGESSYKMLKSALDGSVYAPPENVLIYVTSNRRHLLPEYETDNRGAMLVERRNSSRRGGGGENLPFRPLRTVGLVSPLLPGPVSDGGSPVGRETCQKSGAGIEWSKEARGCGHPVVPEEGGPERPHRLPVRQQLGGSKASGGSKIGLLQLAAQQLLLSRILRRKMKRKDPCRSRLPGQRPCLARRQVLPFGRSFLRLMQKGGLDEELVGPAARATIFSAFAGEYTASVT